MIPDSPRSELEPIRALPTSTQAPGDEPPTPLSTTIEGGVSMAASVSCSPLPSDSRPGGRRRRDRTRARTRTARGEALPACPPRGEGDGKEEFSSDRDGVSCVGKKDWFFSGRIMAGLLSDCRADGVDRNSLELVAISLASVCAQ